MEITHVKGPTRTVTGPNKQWLKDCLFDGKPMILKIEPVIPTGSKVRLKLMQSHSVVLTSAEQEDGGRNRSKWLIKGQATISSKTFSFEGYYNSEEMKGWIQEILPKKKKFLIKKRTEA